MSVYGSSKALGTTEEGTKQQHNPLRNNRPKPKSEQGIKKFSSALNKSSSLNRAASSTPSSSTASSSTPSSSSSQSLGFSKKRERDEPDEGEKRIRDVEDETFIRKGKVGKDLQATIRELPDQNVGKFAEAFMKNQILEEDQKKLADALAYELIEPGALRRMLKLDARSNHPIFFDPLLKKENTEGLRDNVLGPNRRLLLASALQNDLKQRLQEAGMDYDERSSELRNPQGNLMTRTEIRNFIHDLVPKIIREYNASEEQQQASNESINALADGDATNKSENKEDMVLDRDPNVNTTFGSTPEAKGPEQVTGGGAVGSEEKEGLSGERARTLQGADAAAGNPEGTTPETGFSEAGGQQTVQTGLEDHLDNEEGEEMPEEGIVEEADPSSELSHLKQENLELKHQNRVQQLEQQIALQNQALQNNYAQMTMVAIANGRIPQAPPLLAATPLALTDIPSSSPANLLKQIQAGTALKRVKPSASKPGGIAKPVQPGSTGGLLQQAFSKKFAGARGDEGELDDNSEWDDTPNTMNEEALQSLDTATFIQEQLPKFINQQRDSETDMIMDKATRTLPNIAPELLEELDAVIRARHSAKNELERLLGIQVTNPDPEVQKTLPEQLAKAKSDYDRAANFLQNEATKALELMNDMVLKQQAAEAAQAVQQVTSVPPPAPPLPPQAPLLPEDLHLKVPFPKDRSQPATSSVDMTEPLTKEQETIKQLQERNAELQRQVDKEVQMRAVTEEERQLALEKEQLAEELEKRKVAEAEAKKKEEEDKRVAGLAQQTVKLEQEKTEAARKAKEKAEKEAEALKVKQEKEAAEKKEAERVKAAAEKAKQEQAKETEKERKRREQLEEENARLKKEKESQATEERHKTQLSKAELDLEAKYRKMLEDLQRQLDEEKSAHGKLMQKIAFDKEVEKLTKAERERLDKVRIKMEEEHIARMTGKQAELDQLRSQWEKFEKAQLSKSSADAEKAMTAMQQELLALRARDSNLSNQQVSKEKGFTPRLGGKSFQEVMNEYKEAKEKFSGKRKRKEEEGEDMTKKKRRKKLTKKKGLKKLKKKLGIKKDEKKAKVGFQ